MSVYHRMKQAGSSVNVTMLTQAIAAVGSNYQSESVNMQSLGEDGRERIAATQTEMEESIRSAFGPEVKLTPDQIEAGVRTMAAAASPRGHMSMSSKGYQEVALKDESGALALRGPGGNLTAESVNMQAFDDRNFDDYKEASIQFNVLTTKQDAVTEMFFPSLQISADAPALRTTLRSVIVQRNVVHPSDGTAPDRGDKNLAHAFTDPSILENNSTSIIPVVAADNSNADLFVDPAKIAPRDVKVDGQLNKTAPLKIGKEFSYLALAKHGTFAPTEGYDSTDQLNDRIVLSTLAVEVSNGTDTSQLLVNVEGLPSGNFVKDQQGNSNEDFVLNFTTKVISLSKESKDVSNVAAAALAGLTDGVSLRFRIKAHGTVNLNTAVGEVDSANMIVVEAFDAAGPVKIEGALKTAVDALTFNVYGFETTDVTITNSNRSTVGLWVDTTSHQRIFAIGAQAPIYHPCPVNDEAPQTIVQSLVAASRAVSINRGHASITNHFNALRAYVEMGATDISPSEMFPGAADELVPYFKSIDVPVKTKLNSISTHEKGDDIRALFSTIITHFVAEMINRSNYSTALELTRGAGAKPKVIIATDPEIAPWLMMSGDADFLGRNVSYEVQSSVHPDYKGKIKVSFGSDTSIDGLDPCGFGRRGWITELLSTQMVTRRGKQAREVVIQPRELHAATLPVGLEFNVTELSDAIAERL